MTLPTDALPITQDFQELLRALAQPAALAEAAVLVGCLLLSWVVCSALRRVARFDPRRAEVSVTFGTRVVDGVLFPALALLFAWIARYLLSAIVTLAVFRVAIPILTSLVLIRLAVRVLSAAFPESGWTRALERTISWIAWVAVVLWITGLLPAAMRELDGVKWQVGGTTLSLRTLVEGSITAALVMVVALWISAAVEKKIIRGSGADLSVRKIIANVVRTVLLFIGLLFAMSAVGINLTAFSVLGGAVGVGLGFGLQKIAANYISGFVVLAERTLRIGDTVKVDNFEGSIVDIRTRYTLIRAATGRVAIVPNEMLIVQRVENASLNTAESRVQISVALQVAHGTDVRALQPRLEAALASIPRVMQKPAPFIQLTGFVPGGMEIAVKYWLSDPNNNQDGVKSEVNLAILDALVAQKVDFAPNAQRVVLMPAPVSVPAPASADAQSPDAAG